MPKAVSGSEADGQNMRERAVEMTHRLFVDHYVNRDLNAVIAVMAPDLTWAGPLDCQRSVSTEELRRLLEPEYETRVKLSNENWGVREVGGAYVVFGTFRAELDEPNGPHLAMNQSATAVWGMAGKGLRVVHLQVANAYDVPARIGRPAEQGENGIAYVVSDVAAANKRQSVRLRFESLGGRVHYLMDSEILYLEANRPLCNVVHNAGSFSIRSSLSTEAGRLPPSFVRIHRACLANVDRMVSCRRYWAVFDDGSECPIAERRYSEVTEIVGKMMQAR